MFILYFYNKMIKKWRQRRYLQWVSVLLLALFVVTVGAGAGLCKLKTQHNCHSPLPFPCCHVTGAICAGALITHHEPLTTFFQAPVTILPALLSAAIFHPPHA
jgi:hypothetical protein